MKTIISGYRKINDYSVLEMCIKESAFKITEVICSDAEGVDELGKKWAIQNGIPIEYFPADWKTNQEESWMIVNEQMADYAEAAIIIIKNFSEGSMHMLK